MAADGPLSFQSQKNLIFGMANTTSATAVLLTGVNKLTLPAEKQLTFNLGLKIPAATYSSACYLHALDLDTFGQDLPKIKIINKKQIPKP